uniref:Uncharacterized protein n=1 Tax=Oryza brachyantha TaxID=4533 RepID=J3M1I2_ORYBR
PIGSLYTQHKTYKKKKSSTIPAASASSVTNPTQFLLPKKSRKESKNPDPHMQERSRFCSLSRAGTDSTSKTHK